MNESDSNYSHPDHLLSGEAEALLWNMYANVCSRLVYVDLEK